MKTCIINPKKNTYKLQLLLNVVTAVIKASVLSGNNIFYACVKKSLPPVSSATFCIAKHQENCPGLAIQKRMREMLVHDNARPYRDAPTRAPLEHFNWELFDHPPYSRDLSLGDYNVFTYLKNCLRSQLFNNDEEIMENVKTDVRRRIFFLIVGFVNSSP
jgi:hypothetical protein